MFVIISDAYFILNPHLQRCVVNHLYVPNNEMDLFVHSEDDAFPQAAGKKAKS